MPSLKQHLAVQECLGSLRYERVAMLETTFASHLCNRIASAVTFGAFIAGSQARDVGKMCRNMQLVKGNSEWHQDQLVGRNGLLCRRDVEILHHRRTLQ